MAFKRPTKPSQAARKWLCGILADFQRSAVLWWSTLWYFFSENLTLQNMPGCLTSKMLCRRIRRLLEFDRGIQIGYCALNGISSKAFMRVPCTSEQKLSVYGWENVSSKLTKLIGFIQHTVWIRPTTNVSWSFTLHWIASKCILKILLHYMP